MNTRNLLWQIPLLLTITGPLWWDLAADFLNPIKEVSYPKTRAEKKFFMEKVTLVQSSDGEAELLLNADRVSGKENQKVLFLQKVEAQLLGNKQQIDVSANEAFFDTEKQIITLLDDVKLISTEGHKLNTTVLRYMTKHKKVKSAARVNFSGDNMKVSGTSFYYDLVSGDFRVGKRVVCSIW